MKLKYNFVMNKVANKTVAVATGADLEKYSSFIKMNDTGTFIFKRLQKETTKEEILAALEREYDAPRSELESALDEFLSELYEVGVLE